MQAQDVGVRAFVAAAKRAGAHVAPLAKVFGPDVLWRGADAPGRRLLQAETLEIAVRPCCTCPRVVSLLSLWRGADAPGRRLLQAETLEIAVRL